jgi:hypothetical protein
LYEITPTAAAFDSRPAFHIVKKYWLGEAGGLTLCKRLTREFQALQLAISAASKGLRGLRDRRQLHA